MSNPQPPSPKSETPSFPKKGSLSSSSSNFGSKIRKTMEKEKKDVGPWIRQHKRKINELGHGILSKKKRKINDVDKGTANKSSKRKRNDVDKSEDKSRKDEFGDTSQDESSDDDESKEAFIQIGDTDNLSKLSDVGKCFQEAKAVNLSHFSFEEDESSIQIGDTDNLSHLGEAKSSDVGKCFQEAKETFIQIGDTVNLSHFSFEEDESSFLEEEEDDDESKEAFIQIGDTVNLSHFSFEEDESSFLEEDDDESKEAFIQIGDTDNLSHLLFGVGVGEAKSSDVGKCFQDKCFQEDDEAKETFVQIGDTVNLSHLLFTKYRDYLIICNHQNTDKLVKVKAKDLAGKFILLHFMHLSDFFHTWSWKAPIANLKDMYTKLHPKGDFEIVFVALWDNPTSPCTTRQCLQHIFSMMPPCPAIPLSDQKSIQHLQRMFGDHNTTHFGPTSFFIDPTGVVLQSHATPLFLSYGVAAYPFTNERIQFLDSEDSLLRTQPLSMEKLLSSPDRDYLINNKGDQVPLHNLDDKVVGLYFCPCLGGLSTTRDLEVVYQELSQKREDFEIVFIYSHGWCEHDDTCSLVDEDSFLHEIKTMPWLALPFKDTNCIKKLQRVLQYPQGLDWPMPDARLVIIGPHGEFLEPFGTQILSTYGAPAYPFTLLSAVNLVLERAKKVKPEMLWELEAIFTRSIGSQVRFSQFVGKRIIVFYETIKSYSTCRWVWSNTLRELSARYLEMKGTDDEFEVIHILCEEKFSMCIKAPVPWLMHPPFDKDSSADKLMHCVFGMNCGLLAFDADGLVVRLTTSPRLGDKKSFPFFHNGNMENEVLLDVKEKIAFRLESVYKGFALLDDYN